MRVTRRLPSVVFSALLVFGTARVAYPAVITLNPTDFESAVVSEASDGITLVTATLNPDAIPYAESHSATQAGSSSNTSYDLSGDDLMITFEHTREANADAYGWSTGAIYFTVDADVDYLLAGTYAAADSDPRTISQQADLYDYMTSTYIFEGRQTSISTPNESFTLGLEEGDSDNNLTGSLTGTLVAEHLYLLLYTHYIDAIPTASNGSASASGFVSLTIIPEPSTALLLASGLVAMAIGRRSTRRCH